MKYFLFLLLFINSTILYSQLNSSRKIQKSAQNSTSELNKIMGISNLNFVLGDYLSIKDHPKSREVNLEIKVPVGWEVKEGDRPNVVKKFVNNGNSYVISIKENATFFTRKQIKKALEEDDFAKDLVKELTLYLITPQLINQSIVSIDSYPALQFRFKAKFERMGLILPIIMNSWIIFYEDKIIFLQSLRFDTPELIILEQLYSSITNSVILPEQFK